ELKKWRQNNGYSQSDLAKALGVITMTISRWERGTREIPPYLHLALKSLRKKKGEIRGAGRPPMKMKSKKEAKKHGLNLQERKKLMD
ncbi:MAG: helix-turn-helix transcriptional regulator, partial [Thermodesulfovibrionia bacterium]|nr:helix-turn-helix transcriptional regulator [Thermodesulfovibrionia bacterium]